jgi:hypothetical protein
MNTVFQKIVTGILIAAFSLASLPLSSAFAEAPIPPTPAVVSTGLVYARLERAFARQGRTVQRLDNLYGQFDKGFPKIQKLLDRAKALGLDASGVQMALDTYKTVLLNDRATYDQARAIVNGHVGFDTSGKVTDAAAARATIQSLRTVLQQFHTALGGAGKALQEAIRAFRQAHPLQAQP